MGTFEISRSLILACLLAVSAWAQSEPTAIQQPNDSYLDSTLLVEMPEAGSGVERLNSGTLSLQFSELGYVYVNNSWSGLPHTEESSAHGISFTSENSSSFTITLSQGVEVFGFEALVGTERDAYTLSVHFYHNDEVVYTIRQSTAEGARLFAIESKDKPITSVRVSIPAYSGATLARFRHSRPAAPPKGVFTVGGSGVVFGKASVDPDTGSNLPLVAELELYTKSGLFEERPLNIWLQIDQIEELNGAKIIDSEEFDEQVLLANLNLIAPQLGPVYLASFPNIDSSIYFTVSWGSRAAMMTLADTLLVLFSEFTNISLPTLSDLVRFRSQLEELESFRRAAGRYVPTPSNIRELAKANALAIKDLYTMSKAEQLVLQAAFFSISGKVIDMKFWNKILSARDLLITMNDLVIYNLYTRGEEIKLGFVASPVRNELLLPQKP